MAWHIPRSQATVQPWHPRRPLTDGWKPYWAAPATGVTLQHEYNTNMQLTASKSAFTWLLFRVWRNYSSTASLILAWNTATDHSCLPTPPQPRVAATGEALRRHGRERDALASSGHDQLLPRGRGPAGPGGHMQRPGSRRQRRCVSIIMIAVL